MKKTVLQFGIIGGIIVSLFMGISMLSMDENTDMGNAEYIGYASMIIAFSTIFVGVKSYRDKELQGVISFGKAFKIGLYIALVASTLYVISWMVLSEFVMKDFAINYMNSNIADWEQSGLSAEEIKAKTVEMNTWMEYYKNPIIKALITYMEILPVGIFVSLVSAAIWKKN